MKKTRGLFLIITGLMFPAIVYLGLLQIGRFNYNEACSSCHRMAAAQDRIGATVHRNVDCAKCHRPILPLSKMFGVQFLGHKPHTDEYFNKKATRLCLNCHRKTWKNVHVFKGSILFSHERHEQRAPLCGTCHPDSGHRKGVGPVAKPVSSAVCKDCHSKRDAAKPAHVASPPKKIVDLREYEKQPHPPDWILQHHTEGESKDRNCAKCHKDSFCKNCHEKYIAHGEDWRKQHGSEALKDLAPCQVCHLPEGCADCHLKKLPKSHDANWNTNHSKELDIDTCMPCHRLNFCKTCHVRSRPSSHTDTMIRNHSGFSKGKEKVCSVCHEQNPCMDCHKIAMPHPKNWKAAHPKQAKVNKKAVCENCHKKDYCAACHKKEIPATHKVRSTWVKKHGADARAKRSDCAVCHSERFCVSCHNMPMPHPRGWAGKGHSAESKLKPKACDLCHKRSYCDDCHKKSKPASHTGKKNDFIKKHGAMSRGKGAACSMCHKKEYCENCHGMQIPHMPEFLRSHGSTVKKQGEKLCAKCHTKNFCSDCHKHRAKHPAGWLKQHGGKAMDDSKGCLTCHDKTYCLSCHKKQVPGAKAAHPDCAYCHSEKDMKFAGFSVCAGCHDDIAKQHEAIPVKQDCSMCHEPHRFKASAAGCVNCHDVKKLELHSKSDHSDCSKCHKPHSWKPSGRQNCLVCHVDKKDHNAPDDCWMCHPFKK